MWFVCGENLERHRQPVREKIVDKNHKTAKPKIYNVGKSNPLYPRRLLSVLGNDAPHQMYMQGEIDLLQLDGVGFCGSRASSEKGLDITKLFANEAAKSSLVTISGNAKGVDTQAHFCALETGGTTIIVLPEGIDHFRIKHVLKPVWNWSRVLVISQFKPDHIWKSFRAMERNKIIVGLSKSMIVIEAKEKGGSINAAMMAIKKRIPLYVIDYEHHDFQSLGNKRLIEDGAMRLGRKKEDGTANMDKIIEKIKNDSNVLIMGTEQEQRLLKI